MKMNLQLSSIYFYTIHENNDLFSIVKSYHISVAIMTRYDDLNRHSKGCNMFAYYFSDYR